MALNKKHLTDLCKQSCHCAVVALFPFNVFHLANFVFRWLKLISFAPNRKRDTNKLFTTILSATDMILCAHATQMYAHYFRYDFPYEGRRAAYDLKSFFASFIQYEYTAYAEQHYHNWRQKNHWTLENYLHRSRNTAMICLRPFAWLSAWNVQVFIKRLYISASFKYQLWFLYYSRLVILMKMEAAQMICYRLSRNKIKKSVYLIFDDGLNNESWIVNMCLLTSCRMHSQVLDI